MLEVSFIISLGVALALAVIYNQLARIENKLNTMPTNDDLSAKLGELETALTDEIQQVADELAKNGVSQENVDRVTALIGRVKGIVNPA